MVQVVTGDSQEEVIIFRDKQTDMHHNIYINIKTGMILPATVKDVNRRKASHDEGKPAPGSGKTKKKQREQKASKNLLEK